MGKLNGVHSCYWIHALQGYLTGLMPPFVSDFVCKFMPALVGELFADYYKKEAKKE